MPLGLKLVDLLPVGQMNSLFPKKKDNFTFKGTPAQVAAQKLREAAAVKVMPLAQAIVTMLTEKKGISKKIIEGFVKDLNLSGEAIDRLVDEIANALASVQEDYSVTILEAKAKEAKGKKVIKEGKLNEGTSHEYASAMDTHLEYVLNDYVNAVKGENGTGDASHPNKAAVVKVLNGMKKQVPALRKALLAKGAEMTKLWFRSM